MKKIFAAAFAALMMTVMPAMAQNDNSENNSASETHYAEVGMKTEKTNDVRCDNEVSVNAGFLNAIQMADGLLGAAAGKKDINTVGFNIDYSHRISRKVLLGATLGFFKGNLSEGANSRDNYYIAMPHIKVDYMSKKYVTLYGKFGLGVVVNDYKDSNETQTKTSIAFQISPFGIEAGPNQHIRFFYEIGIGMAGTGQLGFRYKF